MLKVLILDDELSAGKVLKLLIEKFIPIEKKIMVFQSSKEALESLEYFNPSLIMLDIEMPEMNGFDFLNKATHSDFDVIFTTAYDQYAIKAIRFSALDYLLKPIDSIELKNAVNKHIILRQSKHPDQHLLVDNLISNLKEKKHENYKLALSTTEGVSFFEPANILYCEGESNYTRFAFVNSKPILISKTLGEYEEILDGHDFIRIHKSFLVNINYVVKVDREGMVYMSDGKTLPISRRRKEAVMNVLNKK